MEEREWEDPDKYRIDDEEINVGEICECGNNKRVQELFCNDCQKVIIDGLRDKLKEYTRLELDFINEVLEGENIPDWVLGREEE